MKVAWNNVNDRLQPMVKYLSLCGITANMPSGAIEQIKMDLYMEMYDYIDEFLKTREWLDLVALYDSVPQQRWDYFKLMNERNAAEHRELRKRTKPVKSLWRPPTGFFNRKLKDPHELQTSGADAGDSGSGVQ